jgi:Domain of unknown function (DUF4189)
MDRDLAPRPAAVIFTIDMIVRGNVVLSLQQVSTGNANPKWVNKMPGKGRMDQMTLKKAGNRFASAVLVIACLLVTNQAQAYSCAGKSGVYTALTITQTWTGRRIGWWYQARVTWCKATQESARRIGRGKCYLLSRNHKKCWVWVIWKTCASMVRYGDSRNFTRGFVSARGPTREQAKINAIRKCRTRSSNCYKPWSWCTR